MSSTEGGGGPPARGSASATRESILRRLGRIEGQVRGVAGMIQDDRHCIDVLQQITAVQAALDKAALALVDDHTRHRIVSAEPGDQEEMRRELMMALSRLVGRR